MMTDDAKPSADDLLEPLKAYKRIYRDSFRRNCESYFDELVKRSGVDVEANRRTAKAYNERLSQFSLAGELLKRKRRQKRLLIFLIVLGGILAVVGACCLAAMFPLAGGITLGVGVLMTVILPILLSKGILPAIRKAEALREELRHEADALKREGLSQMEPLNRLFEGGQFKRLAEKTVPNLKLDDCFDVRRFSYLNEKYGYGKDDEEVSVLGILSGEILGNPFAEERTLTHFMGSCTYTGSIVISWETETTDSEGNVHTEYHSETLYASVAKPKPYFFRHTELVYANEAAPDLHFSRKPGHADDLTEEGRERKIRKGEKKLRKLRERAASKGGSFTEMGSSEFDVLFGALDRDDEVQFRLLFTPLAQKNLLALMKDSEGFGDDFSMKKSGCLNYVASEHSADWDLEDGRERYISHSVDLSREKFVGGQEKSFANLYFDLAPLLSIPLYQQHKPHEFIGREDARGNFTRQERECAVNRMADAFEPPDAETESILKTTLLRREGKSDFVNVTAYAYEGIPRTDYVGEWGGDGNMHEVPVDWIEYVPIRRERTVRLKELGLSDREFGEMIEGRLGEAIAKRGEFSYGHGILCCVSDETDETFDSDFTINGSKE